MRRFRKEQIERERLIAAGDFLGLEELLAREPITATIVPARILEMQRALGVALQKDVSKGLLDLLLSTIVHDAKVLFTLRGDLNQAFQTAAEAGHDMFYNLPDRIRESHLLRLQRIEDHILKLIDRYVAVRARLARIKKAEGGKVENGKAENGKAENGKAEPVPTLKIAPANQPDPAEGAVAL